MGGGNGAKAKQARERNAKAASKGPTSNVGTNSKRLRCSCFKLFLPQQGPGVGGWEAHMKEKHAGKTFEQVFTEVDAK